MEVPEFFVSGYFGVGAARDFLMEKSHSEQKPGKHFAIDDLLDFSNDDVMQVTDGFFVDNVARNSTDSSPVTVVDSCNSISGGEKHFAGNRNFSDSQLSGELCIPYDDLVELEWLSNFVDDSFSAEKNFVGMKRFCYTLPVEIWEEILLRLLPKSLKICKWVCKSWYAMIKNRSLVKKQLKAGRFKGPGGKQMLSLLTILKDDINGDDDRLPCVVEEINLPPISKVEKKNLPMFLTGTHCNGITCFYDFHSFSGGTAILCNIELGQFKLLHTPHHSPTFSFSGAGFGYVPKAVDYKYVKFVSSLDPNWESRAQVYTLGTDSWRELALNGIYCWLTQGVYSRGFYYWWNKGLQSSKNMVISFNMSEEKFHCIKLPHIAQWPAGKFRTLIVWNDLVAFFISTGSPQHSTSYEMWVMVHNFNGIEGYTYWNKHLTIGPIACIQFPLSLWKDDELLMQTRKGGIVSYNLHTKKLKKLSIPGAKFRGASYAFPCLKSLVSVRRKNALNR